MPLSDAITPAELEALRYAPLPGDWAERAACRGMDTAGFFLTRGQMNRREAKRLAKVCDACPVLAYCRTYALRYPLKGWWGSMSEDERKERRKQKREAS